MTHTRSDFVHTLLLGTTCLAGLAIAWPAYAGGPTGATVVSGSATVSNPNSNTTVINQTSEKTLINWQDFSIPKGDTVTFDQPNSSAIVLNRVVGPNASSIYGDLMANGNVWLINGNGIMFGQGSRINVGSLIATTSDISNQDFANGNYNFSKASSNPNASVINQGTITTAKGGSAILSGASVANSGIIQADVGNVVLGGVPAFSVDFDGDNLLRYAVIAPVPQAGSAPAKASVSNTGTISANGGTVLMTAHAAANVTDAVVNNTGIVEARSVSAHDGEIILDAGDGTANAGGTLDASGTDAGQTGGAISVTGKQVNVGDGAKIDASGNAGGGTILVGGGFHGAGTIANAQTTTVGRATITADAIASGNGGKVAIWSNQNTQFAGTISAKGGAAGGNGGYVETSGGQLHIVDGATVVTSAPKGTIGTWLLDPTNIIIGPGPRGGTSTLDNGVLSLTTDPGATDTITTQAITAALEGGTDVTLEASNNITVKDDLVYSATNTLSLLAEHDIDVLANLQNSGSGAVNLIAGWDGTTLPGSSLTASGVFGNNGGKVVIGGTGATGGVAIGSASGTTTIAAASLLVEADNGYAQLGFRGAGGGAIDVFTIGNTTLAAGSTGADYAQIGNGAAQGAPAGNVSGDIALQLGGVLTLAGQTANDGGKVWLGNVAASGSSETGNVTLVAQGIASTGGANLNNIIAGDLGNGATGGNVTIGLTSTAADIIGGLSYSSSNALTFLSSGNVFVEASIQNAGTGNLNVVAGWDGFTLDAGSFADAGVFGNGAHGIAVGGTNAAASVAIGSAGGTTTLAGANVFVSAVNGFAQIGFRGAGGGNIDVVSLGNIALTGGAKGGDYAQIGNGSANGSVGGTITGDINVTAGGTFSIAASAGGGRAWLGNFAASNSSETGNVTLVAKDENNNGDAIDDLASIIGGDIVGGDVLIGLTDAENTLTLSKNVTYNSAHTLSLLDAGNLVFSGSLQNSGSGALNFIAGWDGHTLDPASLTQAGVYGNNGGSIRIGGANAAGNVAVGSAGGLTTLAAANLNLNATNGFAQLGYHGAGGGDINVLLNGGLIVAGGEGSGDFAQIGNGDLTGRTEGNVTGNITVNVAGASQFSAGNSDGGGLAWLGNSAGSDSAETGDVNFTAQTLTLSNEDAGQFLGNDLTGGNVTLALTGADSALTLASAIDVMSPYALTLLVGGDITFNASVQNAGSGNITVLAGWDGFTLDPSQFTNFGVFGNNNANLTIGGEAAFGNVALGGNGTLLVESNTINLDAANGYAQIGYHGAGGGAVTVTSLSDITLTGGGQTADFAQIGNGSLNMDVDGAVSGSTTVTAGGAIALNANTDEGGATGIANSGTSGSGDVSIAANGVTGDIGTSLAAGLPLGDFTLASTGTDTLTIATAANYNSGSILTLLNGGDIVFDASIQNAGGGNITVLAGWDGFTLDPSQFTNAGVFGNNSASLTVGGNAAFGDVALGGNGTVLVEANTISLDAANGYAQIGYHGAGGGAIMVTSLGNITLTGGGETNDFAQIGNGSLNMDVDGPVSGSTTVTADGAIALNANTDGGGATGIANSGTSGSGDVRIAANGVTGDIGTSLAAGLPLGDFFLTSTGTHTLTIATAANYNNGNTLTLLNGGDIVFDASVQNAGSGDITVLAGWDGFTLDSSQFTTAGVFGNNNANLAVGGNVAFGDVALGGNGTLLVESNTINLNAVNGYAQIGNGSLDLDAEGAVSGSTNVTAGGTIALNANTDGGGATGIANSGTSGSGDVNIFSNGVTGDIGTSLAAGLPLGDFTLASTGTDTLTIATVANYNNGNTLTLLNGGDIIFDASVQNAGGGAITVLAGWDGFTLDPSQFTTPGVFGNNGANLTIGGNAAFGDVALGGNGSLLVEANTIDLDAANGYAQIGYHGAGGGAVTVASLSDITLTGGGSTADFAQIGNGSLNMDVDGAVSGSTTVTAGGSIALNANADEGGATGIANSGASGSGDVNIFANGVTGDIGTSLAAGLPLGDFTLASTGTSTLTIATAAHYDSGSTLTLLNGGGIEFDASVQNAGSGNIAVVAGWDGFTLDPSQFSNPGVFGNNNADLTVGGVNATGAVSIGTNSGQTLIESGNITVDAEANTAQIGYASNGSGNIDVFASGNILVEASDSSAQIGNGISGGSGNISGDILVNAGGDLTLNGSSLIGNQTGAEITESGNVAIASQTFGGDIDPSLTNDLPGGNFSLAVAGNSPLIIDAALNYDSGNTLSLSTGGDLTVEQSIQNAGFGAINLASGGILTIGGESADGDVAVGSAQGTTTILAGNLSLDAENGYAQLGYHGAGGGDIFATIGNNLTLTGGNSDADTAQIGNGGLSDDIDGGVTGNIFVQAGGTSAFNAAADGGTVFFGNASGSGETGNVTLISGSLTNANVDILANLFANVAGGDVVTQLTNESSPLTLSNTVNYNSAHSLTLTTSGDLVLAASLENSGSGALTLGGANITIGGDGAAGNVNVGSANGLTTLTGNSLTLAASQGYAQLGTTAGSGSINVNVTGDLALIGGSDDGQYAQIGNGGLLTTGNNSGSISVAAGGNVSLNGGTGKESYAQIGHGGAESNSNSDGYSNVGTITVSGAQIALNSGSGTAAYSQIGNGGFEAGNLLAGGTATNSGDITVNSSQSVTLLSNGQDAYAQIGNGGDQVNLGASADAHGVISGTINVSTPSGSGAVTLTAGPGHNAYTQIGNGGYADNKSDSALADNFSATGSITVSDLSLNGGDVGSNGYAQIGNGDASGNSVSNVSGDITLIANGQVTTVDGTAPNSPAAVGNATGSGTVTGTVTGLPVIPPPPPPVGSDLQTIGVIASLTASSSTPTSDDSSVVVVTPEETVEASTQPAGQTNPAATSSSASSPIAAMSGGESETATASDTTTASIGQSLSPGGAKPGAPAASRTLITGVLRQVVPGAATRTPRGIPPANQDFSSWGNEALWQ